MVLISSAVITAIDHTLVNSLLESVSGLSHLLFFCLEQNNLVWDSPAYVSRSVRPLLFPRWRPLHGQFLDSVPPAAPDTEALQTIDIIASVLPLLERPRMPCSVLRLLSHGDIWP